MVKKKTNFSRQLLTQTYNIFNTLYKEIQGPAYLQIIFSLHKRKLSNNCVLRDFFSFNFFTRFSIGMHIVCWVQYDMYCRYRRPWSCAKTLSEADDALVDQPHFQVLRFAGCHTKWRSLELHAKLDGFFFCQNCWIWDIFSQI